MKRGKLDTALYDGRRGKRCAYHKVSIMTLQVLDHIKYQNNIERNILFI